MIETLVFLLTLMQPLDLPACPVAVTCPNGCTDNVPVPYPVGDTDDLGINACVQANGTVFQCPSGQTIQTNTRCCFDGESPKCPSDPLPPYCGYPTTCALCPGLCNAQPGASRTLVFCAPPSGCPVE